MNLPVKAAANGANTSQNKKCNIDGQHRHLRYEIITALHTNIWAILRARFGLYLSPLNI